MSAQKTLKLTLEEYDYNLDHLIYPSDGLKMAIHEAMERYAEEYHESKIKNLKKSNEN